MAKTAKKNGAGPFVLELIASLIFLWLFWAWGTSASSSSIWTPVFYAGALIGAVTLFLASFGNIVDGAEHMTRGAGSSTLVAAFSLIALLAIGGGLAVGSALATVVLALLLGLIGSAMGKMM
jgi:hypothetical protein